ncbi:restriction endonuclease subunit S [Sphaerotilus sulfidivorans]|uniref:restriction endonuclease subunit S n=1 Tax=Sphaerotilus sp. FB-3 TaxID=2913396 RepID=UPI002041441B|nr:restriction endonuclease subunit S [Sphaerotilus sp. FB-3]
MSLPKYPHYKPSGVQWLGDVPAHWEVSALRRVVYFQRGHDLPSDQREEGDIPVVSSGGVTGTHSKAVASAPGIVTGRYGSIGNFSFIETDYWPLNTALYSIDLFGNSPRWAWYMLQSISEHFVLNSLKAAVPGVDRNDIHVVAVTVPSIAEQTAIAHFLDHETAKIDALIAEQEKLIHLLAEKRQATISHAVTRGLDPAAPMKDSGVAWLGEVPAHWTVTPLKHLVNFRSGGTPSKEKLNYWNGDVPWASAKDMKTDRLADTIDHITAVAIEEKAADLVPRGAVLVVVRGMILARMFPVSIVDTPMAINQDLKAVIPGERIDSEFLAWLLRGTSDDSLRRLDEAGHGTKALRMDAWASMLLPVPPIPEQARIAQFIEQEMTRLAQLQNEAERAIALLKERRAALIAAAVTGQIDVRQNSEILNGGESRDAVAALS